MNCSSSSVSSFMTLIMTPSQHLAVLDAHSRWYPTTAQELLTAIAAMTRTDDLRNAAWFSTVGAGMPYTFTGDAG